MKRDKQWPEADAADAFAALAWADASAARVVKIDGEAVEVRSEKPFAPGARPVGALAGGAEVRVKVHRCRREDRGDGLVFTIDGRLLDATRSLRGELERLIRPSKEPES